MGARRDILAALATAPPGEPPAWRGASLRFDDLEVAFGASLEAAGGSLLVSPAEPPAPFLEGALAVAESGAVWWVPRSEEERRDAFLAEDMRLRVPRSGLVHTLHEAYARLAELPPYGCFVSGPSKTADIEQALVIGAHGPRRLEVWLAPEDQPQAPGD